LKAPAFAYAKPRSLEEAFELLERGGDGAKILAGGQSLIPSLNMRLSSPQLLVDITALPGLAEIRLDRGVLRIGALATHAQIERSEDVRRHVPMLAQAVAHIAHPAIRNRGTLGGSLALADPAAEYPACAVALQATVVVQGRNGERLIPAPEFFTGLFETALEPGELVVAAEFAAIKKDEGSVFLELARRHGDYAIIGLAAHKTAKECRLAFLGAGTKPVLVKATTFAGAQAALEKLEPPADLYHSSATKRQLAKVLVARAWNTLSTAH
jgi:carbon-monoxide dehydrogenase medium subunit